MSKFPFFPHVESLTPSAGTDYFKHETFVVEDYQFKFKEVDLKIFWKVDVYVYATNASPNDHESWSKQGEIKVLVVHSGRTSTPPGDGKKLHYFRGRTYVDGPRIQLPRTNSGATEGDDIQYRIDYTENMAMFKHNETQNFSAAYQDTFVRTKSKQSASVLDGYTEFSIDTRWTVPGPFGPGMIIGQTAWSTMPDINEISGISTFALKKGYYGPVKLRFGCYIGVAAKPDWMPKEGSDLAEEDLDLGREGLRITQKNPAKLAQEGSDGDKSAIGVWEYGLDWAGGYNFEIAMDPPAQKSSIPSA